MDRIIWNDNMSVGIAEFDTDHRVIILTLNEIDDLLASGQSRQAARALADLMIFIRDHMEREIDFLERIGYPGIKVVRNGQLQELQGFEAVYLAVSAGSPDARELVDLLARNMIRYLVTTDLAFKSFIEFKGLSDIRRAPLRTRKVALPDCPCKPATQFTPI